MALGDENSTLEKPSAPLGGMYHEPYHLNMYTPENNLPSIVSTTGRQSDLRSSLSPDYTGKVLSNPLVSSPNTSQLSFFQMFLTLYAKII